MRSTLLRPALCLAVLVLLTPLSRLSAADADPAKPADTPAPAAAPEATPLAPATTPATGVAATAATPAAESTPAAAPAAPAATTSPAPVPDQDSLEAKMAIVLRSYTLLQEENDQLKAAAEKNAAEKAAIEAQLSVAKDALPAAAQVAGLREQLRQTQDQLAAVSLENNELKTKLAMSPSAPGTSNLTPTNVPTTLPPVAAPVAPAPAGPRLHVVAAGDTLSKIAVQYYGSASRWPEILAANRDVLKNEKSLLVGTKLKIP
jgi:nucleoid-associated protein YgaU